MPTVSELIDYLQQMPPDVVVVIDDDDFTGEGDYVSLRSAMQALEDKA